jgi:hypothetical protein
MTSLPRTSPFTSFPASTRVAQGEAHLLDIIPAVPALPRALPKAGSPH